MIQLTLDWREVLWWMQGGMSGSHLRWNVYEDMVNKVWPQASEQERRSMWLIMRRDLGVCWRTDEYNRSSLIRMAEKGEGEWRDDIYDKTPWMYFRQVLARFDPDNQYAVTMRIENGVKLKKIVSLTPEESVISITSSTSLRKLGISCASIVRTPKPGEPDNTITVRTYKWQDEYRIDWSRRCAENNIVKIEKLDIPDDGTM